MKKSIVYLLLFILFSTPLYATDDRYKFLINYHDGRTIYLDKNTLKHEVAEDQELDYYNFWIKIEYSKKALDNLIKTRKAQKLPIKDYASLKCTLEHRIYTSEDKYCIIEKIDYSKDGTILEKTRYHKKKWILFKVESLDFIIFFHAKIQASELEILRDMKK